MHTASAMNWLPRHGLLAALAVLSVCLGLQPCVYAAVADDDCPHVAAGHSESPSSEHGHHGHDMQSAEHDCLSAGPSCCVAEGAAADARPGLKVFKDSGDSPAALPSETRPVTLPHYEAPGNGEVQRKPVASGPPLHVLYCVYLD